VAFKTGDRSILLYNVLDHHQTQSYDQAVAILDEWMELASSKSQRLGKDDADRRLLKYPAGLREFDGSSK
jgi:hypothetical protein